MIMVLHYGYRIHLRQTFMEDSYHNTPVWRSPVQLMDYCTEHSWGCSRCPGATAGKTARCTEDVQTHKVLMMQQVSHTDVTWPAGLPLTLLWLETRQCSHTFTRCSKQKRLVTFLFGHLHRPIVTCAVQKTNKQTWIYAKTHIQANSF